MKEGRLHGVLITNAFLRTEKFLEHYRWLQEAASRRNISLTLLENTDLLSATWDYSGFLEKQGCDFILYWDKDIPQGRQLARCCRERGIPVFNSVDAVAASDNKQDTYQKILEWNSTCGPEEQIRLIPTVTAPMTYANVGYTKLDFVDWVIEQLSLPLILKESVGSFGMQVYLAKTRQEALWMTQKLAGKPFLYQKFIEESCGRDVR
ncbi:MAG: hypothetical protein LUH14_08810, partial [Clostridiaceae bacterium]|nr:hypothetical protein [Clostridiaceae bacterium]